MHFIPIRTVFGMVYVIVSQKNAELMYSGLDYILHNCISVH